jgi:hypothetical protein
MEAVFALLIGIGLIAHVMAWFWFLIVAFRVNEGYGLGCLLIPFPVALIFLFQHWKKAKRPFFLQLAACLPLLVGVVIAPSNPSPEKVAAEVKPLILEEWKKQGGLGNATIQAIYLTHNGGGVYSGFTEARLDGQTERLLLKVVVDRKTIRWETKPNAN